MIRIVYLEDNDNDVILLRRQLERELPEAELHRAATPQEFVQLITAITPDLILADFSLPGLTGREAFALANELAPGIPFIFLSGTVKEDDAIDALKTGASDYVLKDRPKRLATAIQRAIREKEEHRQRQIAEEHLIRAQRLENIGLLASGIAHDFNNILAPILMAAPMLRERTTDAADQQLLMTIEQCAVRGANLVRHILAFAHGSGDRLQEVILDHVLRDVVSVAEYTFPKSIRVEVAIAPDLWVLRANPTHLHQVLLNLAVNARDAMPDGGTLTIRAGNVEVDPTAAAAIPRGRVGRFVHLEIEDTGTGIPAKIMERIWEPFFTTKTADRGTGLGLSTVRAIVEEGGGFAEVRTILGRGSCFHVYLPASPQRAAPSVEPIHPSRRRGSGELILVVDDDPHIREVVAATLANTGYRVFTARDATEALALFAPRMSDVKAVMTDLDMPGMNGGELAKVIRTLSKPTRIIAVTGSVEEGNRANVRTYSDAILVKPFTVDAMLASIEAVLSRPLSRGGSATPFA